MQDRELCAALRDVDALIGESYLLGSPTQGIYEGPQHKLDYLLERLHAWRREHQTALVRAAHQA